MSGGAGIKWKSVELTKTSPHSLGWILRRRELHAAERRRYATRDGVRYNTYE